MRYSPHDEFVAHARPRSELWRTLAGAVLAVVAGVALSQFAFAVVAGLLGPAATARLVDETTFHGDTPLGTLLVLFSFGFFAIGLALALRAVHGRGLMSLVGGWEGAVSDFMRVFMATLALNGALLLLMPGDVSYQRDAGLALGAWLLLLPVSLAAVAVQAGSEELFFRGYLQQQLGARLPGTGLWLALPAALFGLAHYAPAATGESALAFAVWAAAFGLAAGDLTARTGALGAAIGLHMANNVLAVLVAALAGPGSGLALWVAPATAEAALAGGRLWVELGALVCSWLAARIALRV